jgi:hypothetical protein
MSLVAAENVFQGSLFSSDFLRDAITRAPDWREVSEPDIALLAADLRSIFARFPMDRTTNESQTEEDLIWPVLARLGWTASLRQQNLASRGRDDVPDGLLFSNDAVKAEANAFREEWKRYNLGVAIVESKRWKLPLDRQSGRRGEETAPSTQMLRYLRRVEDLTTGRLRWGLLTNGARWRLYYQGARSVSEQFFELDLAIVLGVAGDDGGLFALTEDERRHWLKVFALVFRRDAFLPTPSDARTFHQRAIEEGRFYEQRVAASLSDLVFGAVFPELAKAIAAAAPDAPLEEVRQGALIVLYRLLFILYAEDRDLLPVRDGRYDDYGLREKVRGDVGRRRDRNDVFSQTAARYWSVIDDLCRAIDKGDGSIGLPPYNGGLFDRERTPILNHIRIGDAVMAGVIDALSFERTPEGRKYINYRDLSVQQLGSIYERLLEYELIRDGGSIVVRPNVFARKGSGSYYTPDDLVGLIVRETIGPLVDARMEAFAAKAKEVERSGRNDDSRRGTLGKVDPASKILELKICDPAMGSGHFLVSLVDFLTDRIIAAIAEARALVPFVDYDSPLILRIADIRSRIFANAEDRGWTIDFDQLDDRHIVRRMILKRCVYGIDKNPMAVELAKVALWLHTFTVGAPLSFLDHHLRCGDSLFGAWVRAGMDKAAAWGAPLLLHQPMARAIGAAAGMRTIEGLTDIEIAEAHNSALMFTGVVLQTAPLDAFLSFIQALDWLAPKTAADKAALTAFFDGQFGDPVSVASGEAKIVNGSPEATRFAEIFAAARELIGEERFLNWQVTFLGVWSAWESAQPTGGFDAVIGNPPWDRMKLQQVEWFAARRPEIAMAQRASDRARMIAALAKDGDPLAGDYAKASARAETAAKIARTSGNYPLLSGGDTNINSLFIERAKQLCAPGGIVGLLVPSGIATEMASQEFFSNLIENDNIKCVYDFFNKRDTGELFFPDVYYRFKFSAFVFSPSEKKFGGAQFATFVRSVADLEKPGVIYTLSLTDFKRVNPNTVTAPIYRAQRDKDISTLIYGRLPILVDRSGSEPKRAWPVRYTTLFHMANDSRFFRTRKELEEKEGAYPLEGNLWKSADGDWVPLYEGKMVQAFDHRASGITTVAKNLHRPGQGIEVNAADHVDTSFFPESRYFVKRRQPMSIQIALKDITSTTNARSIISCLLPPYGAGHTLPIIDIELAGQRDRASAQALLCGNLNSLVLDFVARTKILGNHASWYIVEQLPVVPPRLYDTTRFGPKTAGEIVRAAVLELTYTAHDMAPFARDMGHVDAAGNAKPPFVWNEERRLKLRAKLDAVYFHLYGVTDRDDVRHVYSTFPIVEREEVAAHGRYRSRELCLAYMNALAAGDPDADIRS